MKKNTLQYLTLIGSAVMLLCAAQPVHAQQWLQANGNLYTLPAVKIGIGTAVPQRNFEVLNTLDNYIRVGSVGGDELGAYSAGIELKRSLFTGQNTTWSIENESTFKIKNNGVRLFELSTGAAWLGTFNGDPIEFAINGKSIDKVSNTLIRGAISLKSSVGNTQHTLRMDGNQLESDTDLHLNDLSDASISLANGGGKVKVGTTDTEARLSVASAGDVQLKLINPGNGGGAWRIGASNNGWQAGGGKFIISNSANSADAALVINGSNSVGIGTTTPNSVYRLSVNGKIRAKEIVVETGWADFVFEKDYVLMPLEEVEAYIRDNQHLPHVPSAKTIEANGVNVGEMEAVLLRKIEELTLYLINLKKENAALSERVTQLEK